MGGSVELGVCLSFRQMCLPSGLHVQGPGMAWVCGVFAGCLCELVGGILP